MLRQRRLAQPRRPVKQHVVQRLLAPPRRLQRDLEGPDHLAPARCIPSLQPLRPQRRHEPLFLGSALRPDQSIRGSSVTFSALSSAPDLLQQLLRLSDRPAAVAAPRRIIASASPRL